MGDAWQAKIGVRPQNALGCTALALLPIEAFVLRCLVTDGNTDVNILDVTLKRL